MVDVCPQEGVGAAADRMVKCVSHLYLIETCLRRASLGGIIGLSDCIAVRDSAIFVLASRIVARTSGNGAAGNRAIDVVSIDVTNAELLILLTFFDRVAGGIACNR